MYGPNAMSCPAIVKWYQQFEQGRTDVGDADREVRPTTSTTKDSIQKVNEMIRSNHRVSQKLHSSSASQ
ncbi:hypothetical protein C0J52_06228 [Blattella germanica]|nr:hypothetical protein C0J52_06228 [Blattella germanica]